MSTANVMQRVKRNQQEAGRASQPARHAAKAKRAARDEAQSSGVAALRQVERETSRPDSPEVKKADQKKAAASKGSGVDKDALGALGAGVMAMAGAFGGGGDAAAMAPGAAKRSAGGGGTGKPQSTSGKDVMAALSPESAAEYKAAQESYAKDKKGFDRRKALMSLGMLSMGIGAMLDDEGGGLAGVYPMMAAMMSGDLLGDEPVEPDIKDFMGNAMAASAESPGEGSPKPAASTMPPHTAGSPTGTQGQISGVRAANKGLDVANKAGKAVGSTVASGITDQFIGMIDQATQAWKRMQTSNTTRPLGLNQNTASFMGAPSGMMM